jgi:RNA polymerase sigma-70 factor (ECF subfamily)
LALLERALARLRDEAIKADNEQLFDRLKCSLTGDLDRVTHRRTAELMGTTEGAVRAAVHRLRKRYRELLRDEIALTVSSQDEIEAEIRDLFDAFAN